MRPKSAIFTPERDNEHPLHFSRESPPGPTFMHEYVCVAGGILKGSITT